MEDNPKEQEREGFLQTLKKKFSRRSEEKKEGNTGSSELDTFVEESSQKGVINGKELEMISNIIHLPEKITQEVMTNIAMVSSIDGEAAIEDVFERIMEDGYSRYPVYMGDRENIVGMFHIRDFLRAYADTGERKVALKESKYNVVGRIESVPDTRKISRLFADMQRDKRHMALVKDEYGQTAGIVTMEDILEEIFGNILDEHDKSDAFIKELEEDKIWHIDGNARLEDVEKELDISFETDDYETLSGFLTGRIGHIPEEEDEGYFFKYRSYVFIVKQVENRVVKEVLVKKI